MSYQTEIEELLELADSLEASPEQEKLLGKAIQLAQFHNDLDLEFRAKTEYISCVVHQNYHQKALVVFPWLLAQLDKYPDRFYQHRILWQYKWMLTHLPDIPSIAKSQIMAVFEDVTKRYLAFGESMRTMHSLAWEIYMALGDMETSKSYFEKYLSSPDESGYLIDCDACVLNTEIDYWIAQGEYYKAISIADPILKGELTCLSVPKTTHAKMILANLVLERTEQAEEFFKKGIRSIKNKEENNISSYRYHLIYLTAAKRFTKAVSIVENQLIHALLNNNDLRCFYFYLATGLLFEKISQEVKKKTIKLHLSTQFPLYQADQTYEVSKLAAWFGGEAQQLAGQFDTRNGNDYYSRKIEQFRELVK